MALSKLGARLGRKVQSLEYTLEHKISIQKYNKFEIVCHSKKYTTDGVEYPTYNGLPDEHYYSITQVLPLEANSGVISFPIEGPATLSSKACKQVSSSTHGQTLPRCVNIQNTPSRC